MKDTSRQVRMMGTIIDLTVNHKNYDAILDKLISDLKVYEQRFNANNSKSELMRVNHNAGIKSIEVHPDLFELIEIGKAHSIIQDSLLNVAIGPLVQSWRIGFNDAKIPSHEKIKKLLKLIDPHKIYLDESKYSVYLEDEGMLLDLGALAKGYIADLLIEYLRSVHVKSAMINLGGNIVVLGDSINNKNSKWRIGIRNPKLLKNENIAVIEVKNKSVVTSGIYERTILHEGKTYHHILDSKTGYPVNTDVASLTIVSNLSLVGEIWTTRLFGKESYTILNIVNNLQGIECLIVTITGEILKSNKLEVEHEHQPHDFERNKL